MSGKEETKEEVVSAPPLQIDYGLRRTNNPKYTYLKIPMSNLPTGLVNSITATTTQLLEWKLPSSRVYNLSRSYISGNINFPAQGASKYTWMFEDSLSIANQIRFGTAGGLDLVNLTNANNYSKIAMKLNTPIDKLLTAGEKDGLYKCNSAFDANIVPGGRNRTGGANMTYAATDNYIEPGYSSTSDANTAYNKYFQIELGKYAGTMLAVDRDFFCPTEMWFRMEAGPGDKMAFMSTCSRAAAMPSPGVDPNPVFPFQPPASNPAAGAASLAAPPTLNNVFLHLAVEQNKVINATMLNLFENHALRFQIPYTVCLKQVGGAANSTTNISHQLSNTYGNRLKRITHTVWNGQEKFNTAYDISNFNGEKIESYQTFLESRALQDRVLTCLQPSGVNMNSDDWMENRRFCTKDSCITSQGCYATNWFHMDQFYEAHDKDKSLPECNLEEGLPMKIPMTWQITANIPSGGLAGLVHYTFAEFSRIVDIAPEGPKFIAAEV